MATATTVPVEVYLRSSYEPDAEYVDGAIEARPRGENDYAGCQEAILAYFREHRREWNTRVVPELKIQISRTRYRVPDITVLDRDLPIGRSSPFLRSASSRFSRPTKQ